MSRPSRVVVSSLPATCPPDVADAAGMDRLDARVLPLRGDAMTACFARALDALCAGSSSSANPVPVADGPARAPLGEETSEQPSVACGACAGRVGLRDFVLIGGSRMTRTADCPQCGETTAISLAFKGNYSC